MKKVMFVCHGNICRSPMAECILKNIAKENNNDDIYVDSSATSYEEIGNSIHRGTKRILEENDETIYPHFAKIFTLDDYKNFDYIVCMDEENIRNLFHIIKNDPDGKVYKLLDFTNERGDIEDPWYTDNFEKVYYQIKHGCDMLYKKLNEKHD